MPKLGVVVLALVALVAMAAYAGVEHELRTPRELHQVGYVQAAQCQRCHPDHAASFARTFHRTMTQPADARSVRGDFEGQSLEYFGARAELTRTSAGGFRVRYQVPGAEPALYDVVMTVGSRRYQQYIGRRGQQQAAAAGGQQQAAASGGQELVRLPVAYHLEERRWFHMNGAFLTPDPPEPLSRADYERHVTRWNDNCVFCHNVAPNPGKHAEHGAERFDTEVAELGIACEACHGPGAEHERANTNPLRRYLLQASDRPDPAIVNPARLSQARALDLCGRCHGQRITDDVERFLQRGDPFVPGDDLALYSAPLWRDTTLRGEAVFETRFWHDGTPRLTAYEYQGALQSACARSSRFTCLSCHAMHAGDPRGQLRPDRPDAALCTQCHEQLESERAQREHAQHDADSLPSCVDCHMPKLVYGVLEAHRSHRIEVPDVVRAAEHERPDACTQCHVERTRAWAATQAQRLWPRPGRAPSAAEAELGAAPSEQESQLFGGDPIQRALAAAALRKPAPAAARPRRLALLLEAVELDPYPAVRQLALRAARAQLRDPVLESFIAEQPLARRQAQLANLRARFPLSDQDTRQAAQLRERASAQAIDIGE